MNASVHFSTFVTRISRGSLNSEGLAKLISSPGAYWSASRSLTSRLGSSTLSVSRRSRIARSARNPSVPLTRTIGAGRTLFHANCGIATFGLADDRAGGLAATGLLNLNCDPSLMPPADLPFRPQQNATRSHTGGQHNK